MTFDEALTQYRECRTQYREAKSHHSRCVSSYNDTKKPTDKAKARLEALAVALKPEMETPGVNMLDSAFDGYMTTRNEYTGLLRDLEQKKQRRDDAEQRLSMHASSLRTAATRLLPELAKEVRSDLGEGLVPPGKDEPAVAADAEGTTPEVADTVDATDAVEATV
jgi:chromosome segregation ATPase